MLEYRLDPVSEMRQTTFTVEKAMQAFPFYLFESGHFRMGDRYFTCRDGLRNYLLIATVSGRGKLFWKEKSCVLAEKSVVLIDCDTFQEYQTLPGETWEFYYIHFGSDCFDGYRRLLLDTLSPVTLHSTRQIRMIFEDPALLSPNADMAACAAQSNAVSALLTEMLSPTARGTDSGQVIRREDIAGLADYISAHCAEPLCLEDFVNLSHLSKYHLIRLFEKQIGMPPYRYLHLCRIHRAQELLRDTDGTLSQIAEQVGYADPSVFIRHFRSFHGTTPGEYRKNCILLTGGH